MPSSSFMADLSLSTNSEASTSGSAAYIEHTVTRLDTLAGVAIKYGVEVADVKRFNGLTTDLQMFALKTLRIPTPGRHPPSALLTSPTQSRCENFAPIGSYDVSRPSSGKHLTTEKTRDTSTMELLRDYYGLPSKSTGAREGLEMVSLSYENESDLDDEAFLPMFRPPNTADSRRYSTGDYRSNRCGYVRESCNNILDSCWSVTASEPTEFSHLMKSSKNVAREGDAQSKETPVRRRTTTSDGSERVNIPRRDPTARLKDSNSSSSNAIEGPRAPSGVKTIGAALWGGKEAVDSLLSKVMLTSSSPAASQECSRASTGSFGVVEGLTSVYRRAKAALD